MTARGRLFARACSTAAGFCRVICGGLRFISQAKKAEAVFVCVKSRTSFSGRRGETFIGGGGAGGVLITVSVNEKRLETHKVVLMLHLFPSSSSCR